MKTLLLIIAVVFIYDPAFALSIRCMGSPWYKAKLTVKSKTFPSKFLVNDDEEFFILRNPTKDPIFLLVDGKKTKKIQENEVFERRDGEWVREIVTRVGPGIHKPKYAPTEMQIHWRSLDLLGLSREVKEKINRVQKASGSGRPDQPVVSEPVDFEFKVEFAGKVHTINGQVSQSINDKYNPSLKPGSTNCFSK